MSEREDDLEEFGLAGEARVAEQVAPPTSDGEANDPLNAVSALLGKSPAFARYVAARAAASNAFKVPLTKTQNYQISFGPITIPPYSSMILTQMPQCLFRGDKIVCTGDTAAVVINSLFVGQRSQFPQNTRAIPFSVFGSNALGSGIKLDTCEVGLSISISVENISAKPVKWGASIFGRAV